MTSNSHDSARTGQINGFLLCFFMVSACVPAFAADTPAPALVEILPTVKPPIDGAYHGERVDIRKARAKTISKEDSWVKRIVHPDDYVKLQSPVLISAEVVRPFNNLARTASPVIVLNGKPLTNSIVVRNKIDHVHAVVLNGTQLKSIMNIQVGWFGALPETLSPSVRVKLVQEN